MHVSRGLCGTGSDASIAIAVDAFFRGINYAKLETSLSYHGRRGPIGELAESPPPFIISPLPYGPHGAVNSCHYEVQPGETTSHVASFLFEVENDWWSMQC